MACGRRVARLFIVFTMLEVSFAYQTVCFIGNQGWKGVADLQYEVDDSKNIEKSNYVSPAESMGFKPVGDLQGKDTFAFRLAVAQGVSVNFRFRKDGVNFNVNFVVTKDVYQEESAGFVLTGRADVVATTDGNGTVADSKAVAPTMYWIMTRVHHGEVWDDFFKGNLKDGVVGAHNLVVNSHAEGEYPKKLAELWHSFEQNQKSHTLFSITMFADGFPYEEGEVGLEFQYQAGDSKPRTAKRPIKKTGPGVGGIFAGWRAPREVPATFKIKFRGKTNSFMLDTMNLQSVEDGVQVLEQSHDGKTGRVIFLLFYRHGSQDKCWREVQKYEHVENGRHPFWDSSSGRWKLEALKDLWKKTIVFDGVGGPETSVEETQKSNPILKIVLVCVALVAASLGVFYCCCQEAGEDDSYIERPQVEVEASPPIPNNQVAVESAWPTQKIGFQPVPTLRPNDDFAESTAGPALTTTCNF